MVECIIGVPLPNCEPPSFLKSLDDQRADIWSILHLPHTFPYMMPSSARAAGGGTGCGEGRSRPERLLPHIRRLGRAGRTTASYLVVSHLSRHYALLSASCCPRPSVHRTHQCKTQPIPWLC